jgi:hypothetical protein
MAGKAAIHMTKILRLISTHRVMTLRRHFALVVLLVFVGGVAHAQSGRRAPTPQATPGKTEATPVSEPAPETNKAAAKEESARRINLVVARHSTSKTLPSEDAIYASFVNRLNEFGTVATTSIEDLNRDQAIKRAKAETDAFVVLMQFEIDSFQRGTIVRNSPDLKITYFVFAPRSGKEMTKDKIYFQAIGGARARKDEWPKGPPLKITPAAAGIAAADRLHDWLVLVIRAQEKQ